MSSGERPIGATKGKQSDTEALCQKPPSSGPPELTGITQRMLVALHDDLPAPPPSASHPSNHPLKPAATRCSPLPTDCSPQNALQGREVTPPPGPPGRPAYAQPLSPPRQVPASMALVTNSNRPQPLSQRPPTACLTASGTTSEVPSILNAALSALSHALCLPPMALPTKPGAPLSSPVQPTPSHPILHNAAPQEPNLGLCNLPRCSPTPPQGAGYDYNCMTVRGLWVKRFQSPPGPGDLSTNRVTRLVLRPHVLLSALSPLTI